MQQNNNAQNTTQAELTTQSVFGLNFANTCDLCLVAKNKYQHGEPVTVSNMIFHKRLLDKVGDLFDETFDWSNIIIAGGFILGLIERKADPAQYATSDIDIFVYGKDKTEVINKIQAIYNYFLKKLGGAFYAFVHVPDTATLNIIIPGERFPIQVIGTTFKNPMEVLNSFDMTHCQVGYVGDKILYTKEFISAIQTQTTKITKRSIHAYRLVKAYYRGYSIYRPEYCYIKNIFHEYTSNPGEAMPSNTDKQYDINNLQGILEELSKNPIVIQNLTKNYIPAKHKIITDVAKEMEKIGESYAGKNKYEVVNCFNVLGLGKWVKDITGLLKFTRAPFHV